MNTILDPITRTLIDVDAVRTDLKRIEAQIKASADEPTRAVWVELRRRRQQQLTKLEAK